MTDAVPVLELQGVRKAYGGLRPLRLDALRLERGGSIALLDVELPAVEVLVNLVTGVTLPDEGEVRLFGRTTASIENGDEWLALLDRFGMVSERVVLLEQLSIAQNLAVPFTLELDEMPAAAQQDVARLRDEVGLSEASTGELVARAQPDVRARLRLARAIALDPHLLLLEHPTAGLPRDAVAPLARDIRTIAARRGLTVFMLTGDRPFAEAAADELFTHEPATGALKAVSRGAGWKRWFSRA